MPSLLVQCSKCQVKDMFVRRNFTFLEQAIVSSTENEKSEWGMLSAKKNAFCFLLIRAAEILRATHLAEHRLSLIHI